MELTVALRIMSEVNRSIFQITFKKLKFMKIKASAFASVKDKNGMRIL